MWHLFRCHGRPGLCLSRCRRPLGAHRPRPAGGPLGRGANAAMIRVVLPYHLQTLARVGAEVELEVARPVTQSSVLDALEARYPMLCGTVRDHVTKQRRALVGFSAGHAAWA